MRQRSPSSLSLVSPNCYFSPFPRGRGLDTAQDPNARVRARSCTHTCRNNCTVRCSPTWAQLTWTRGHTLAHAHFKNVPWTLRASRLGQLSALWVTRKGLLIEPKRMMQSCLPKLLSSDKHKECTLPRAGVRGQRAGRGAAINAAQPPFLQKPSDLPGPVLQGHAGGKERVR